MDDLTQREAAKLDRLLRRSEAAKYITDKYGIPCSPKTLAKLACISSDGPPFRLAGRFPLYPVSGLSAPGLREQVWKHIAHLIRISNPFPNCLPIGI